MYGILGAASSCSTQLCRAFQIATVTTLICDPLNIMQAVE